MTNVSSTTNHSFNVTGFAYNSRHIAHVNSPSIVWRVVFSFCNCPLGLRSHRFEAISWSRDIFASIAVFRANFDLDDAWSFERSRILLNLPQVGSFALAAGSTNPSCDNLDFEYDLRFDSSQEWHKDISCWFFGPRCGCLQTTHGINPTSSFGMPGGKTQPKLLRAGPQTEKNAYLNAQARHGRANGASLVLPVSWELCHG